jgi:DNA-binding response OmpR family regulator
MGAPREVLTVARILIVEDHAEIAELLAETLEAAGHQVAVADSADAAVIAFVASPPELVIMDMLLNCSNGIAAALRLRSLGFKGPIVAASAELQPIAGELYQSAGFACSLQKPFKVQDLVAVVEQLLEPST